MNLWKEFVDGDPKISAKLNGLPKIDPMVEMVDSALQDWMAKKRDIPFEFTPENRQTLIQIVKQAVKYDLIQDSPFYQYVRAYISHLYFWLLELQRVKVEMGDQRSIKYLEIFEEVIAEAFILGYSMRTVEPKKKGGK